MNESTAETVWKMDLRVTKDGNTPINETLLLLSDTDQQSHLDQVETAHYGLKRLVTSNLTSGSYRDISLLSLISFRYNEYLNRQSISKIIEAGHPTHQQNNLTSLMFRHDLSQGTQEHLNELEWRNDRAMTKKNVLFTASEEKWPVPKIICQRFARYVRRCFGGHPAIIQRIATADALPRRIDLTFWFGDKPLQNTIEIIQSTQDSIDSLIQPSSLSPNYGDDQLAKCIEKAYCTGSISEAELEKELACIREYLYKELWFPAFLTVLTLAWSHPITIVPQEVLNLARPLSKVDPTAERLHEVLDSLQQEQGDIDIASVTKTMQQMRQAAADRAYVLDILIGTVLLMHKKQEYAISAYLAGLQVNPRLVSPYHDLGLIFAQMYNYNDAYRCWDVARWLSPKHPIMSDVEACEHNILTAETETPFGQFVPV